MTALEVCVRCLGVSSRAEHGLSAASEQTHRLSHQPWLALRHCPRLVHALTDASSGGTISCIHTSLESAATVAAEHSLLAIMITVLIDKIHAFLIVTLYPVSKLHTTMH